MAVLVGPPASLLVLAPFLARFLFGGQVSLVDVAIIALAAAALIAFIVRLSAAYRAESQALQAALDALAQQRATAVAASRETLRSRCRWRTFFEQCPTARVCFDASALYDLLRVGERRPGERLGDVLKTELGSLAGFFANIRLVEANRVAIDLCGDRLSGSHFTEASLEAFCEALNGARDDGVVPSFPAELIRADGSLLNVEVHYRVSPNQDPPWSLCMATYVDASRSRRVAREHWEAALEAAEAANRAKSDFLAVISHEIRTPLNGILGMTQAMEHAPLARAQRARLAVIGESGEALLGIVDDLLDLAKIEAGRLEIANAVFDLQAVVEGAHAAYAAEAARKELAFALEIDPRVAGLCWGDAGRVRQVIGALISNALKFTLEGGIVLRLLRTASGVACEVRDTGIGIAPDRVDKLFEKFELADASMTRRYGGAGLGLAICQQVARAMGGAISVSSAPGRGSAFVLDLPLAPNARSAAREGFSPAAGGSLRILAAEDNPVNQLVLKALLGQIGLDPTIVENGMEAVHACETADWDLVLMDIQMPLMDGEAATRLIRAREAELGRPATPIIAVTANTMSHQVASYRAAGASGVVSKPINAEELFSAMKAAVAVAEPQPSARPRDTSRRSHLRDRTGSRG